MQPQQVIDEIESQKAASFLNDCVGEWFLKHDRHTDYPKVSLLKMNEQKAKQIVPKALLDLCEHAHDRAQSPQKRIPMQVAPRNQ